MLLKTKFYVGIVAVFVASLIGFFGARNNDLVQALLAIPMVGSLGGALFQMLRDMAEHERSLILLDAQQHFALGASSHMANVAFDKHVLFAEEYVKEAQLALLTVFREGPTEKVLEGTGRLHKIREAHIVWLTPAVESGLDVFESALRKLGAMAGFVKSTEGSAPYQEQRQQAMQTMYKTLAQVLAFPEWDQEKLTDELAIAAAIRKLRKLLGVEELTEMRHAIVAKAVAGLASRELTSGSRADVPVFGRDAPLT